MTDLTDEAVKALLDRHKRFLSGDDVPILCASEGADLARALLEARAENARLRADAQAAVALVMAKAAQDAYEKWYHDDKEELRDFILGFAPLDSLAMVEALRKERDAGWAEAKYQEAERDRLAADLAAAQAQIEALRDVARKAANRLDWCAGLIESDKARDQASEWADETRAALTKPEGDA